MSDIEARINRICRWSTIAREEVLVRTSHLAEEVGAPLPGVLFFRHAINDGSIDGFRDIAILGGLSVLGGDTLLAFDANVIDKRGKQVRRGDTILISRLAIRLAQDASSASWRATDTEQPLAADGVPITEAPSLEHQGRTSKTLGVVSSLGFDGEFMLPMRDLWKGSERDEIDALGGLLRVLHEIDVVKSYIPTETLIVNGRVVPIA